MRNGSSQQLPSSGPSVTQYDAKINSSIMPIPIHIPIPTSTPID